MENQLSTNDVAALTAIAHSLTDKIQDGETLVAKSEKKRLADNIKVLETLVDVHHQYGEATDEQKAILRQYRGWGGLPKVFDASDDTYQSERDEIQTLVSDQEYRAMKRSTLDSHYTSKTIIDAMYKAVDKLGFKAGRILDPAVGTGRFIEFMPASMQDNSKIFAVEKDTVTHAISSALHPDVNHFDCKGFEDINLVDDQFDLVIGNPPYGVQSVHDVIHTGIARFSLHNFFFAKSILKMRPGGILAMVVSRYLMDAMDEKARAWMARRVRFLGAVRLPETAFKSVANTEVVTDIIFLQKLGQGIDANPDEWVESEYFGTEEKPYADKLNPYFKKHPEMVLGDIELAETGRYHAHSLTVRDNGKDLGLQLDVALSRLPKAIYKNPLDLDEPTLDDLDVPDADKVKVFGYAFDAEGQLVQRLPDRNEKKQWAVKSDASDKDKERYAGMLMVRDALVHLLAQERDDAHNDDLAFSRGALNRAYDGFVNKFGALHAQTNQRLFREDPEYPLLQGLELNYDKGISAAVAKKEGVSPRKSSWDKAAIFDQRVNFPEKVVTSADTPEEALSISLAMKGRVDLPYMAGLLNETQDYVINALQGQVFFDPELTAWVERDSYLSGNVKRKLKKAQVESEAKTRYKINVDALNDVQPPDLEATDITVPLNAPWLNPKYVAAFIEHITEAAPAEIPVHVAGVWYYRPGPGMNQAKNTKVWGTERRPASDLLERLLNEKPLTVFDTNADDKRVVNPQETMAAEEKAEEIKREWQDWVWLDGDRREDLTRTYNDLFNTHRVRSYDGEFLVDEAYRLPGMSHAISLRPHQVNAVWRMVSEQSVLLDHKVGAGKTFTAVAGAMELRRMGLGKKTLFVVPNHLVSQWQQEAMTLYPNAKILAARKQDFEKKNRQRFMARVATGDWDIIIVAHSSFGFIDMPAEEKLAFIQDQISEIMSAIQELSRLGDVPRYSIKQLERRQERLEEKLKKLILVKPKDNLISFDLLGVDNIVVDESDMLGKNLMYATSKYGVKGLGTQDGSQKAMDLFTKVRWLQKRGRLNGVYLLTATPISNSVVELFTVLRYLMWEELQDRGLHHFDAWSRVFAEPTSAYEMSVSGTFKLSTRFRQFNNVPELMSLYRTVADVITKADLVEMFEARGLRWPEPKMRGGKPENVIVPRSDEQKAYMADVLFRAEHLSGVDPKVDNMLKITSDARKAALDMRLVDPSAPDFSESKVNLCVRNVLREYHAWHSDRGTQLIFCDLSTPKKAKKVEASQLQEKEDDTESSDVVSLDEALSVHGEFSVYDDLKAKLIAAGIPENEIAYIHDANTDLQKFALFDKVNRGIIRVLIGSTHKMGAGTNVQERMVALHHLDCPWRPRDLEQRDGRGLRQGNKLYERDPDGFELALYRYGVELTLDAFMWSTVEIKANFIEQLKKGGMDARIIEDIDSDSVSYASMKAELSGNPLILKHFELTQELKKLDSRERAYKQRRFRMEDDMKRTEHIDERTTTAIAGIHADLATAAKLPAPVFNFERGTVTDRTDVGKVMVAELAQVMSQSTYRTPKDVVIGRFRGFEVALVTVYFDTVIVSMTGEYLYREVKLDRGRVSPSGLVVRFENIIDSLNVAEAEVLETQARVHRERATMQKELAKTFADAERIAQVRDQLKRVEQYLAADGDEKAQEKIDVSDLMQSSNDAQVDSQGSCETCENPEQAPQPVMPQRRVARRGTRLVARAA